MSLALPSPFPLRRPPGPPLFTTALVVVLAAFSGLGAPPSEPRATGAGRSVLDRADPRFASMESRRPTALAPNREPFPRWLPPTSNGFEVLAPFHAPAHEYASGHRGVDLDAPTGGRVTAPAGGTVSFSGAVAGRAVVSVRVDERTVYTLEPVESGLAVGDRVGLGAELGVVASGGHCVDACVHLGVRVDDVYVNPARYFFARPELLPWRSGAQARGSGARMRADQARGCARR